MGKKVHASLFSGFGAADLAATWMGWDNAFWCARLMISPERY